jgi:hypothetical protein
VQFQDIPIQAISFNLARKIERKIQNLKQNERKGVEARHVHMASVRELNRGNGNLPILFRLQRTCVRVCACVCVCVCICVCVCVCVCVCMCVCV